MPEEPEPHNDAASNEPLLNSEPAAPEPTQVASPAANFPSVPDGSQPYREYPAPPEAQPQPGYNYPPPPSANYGYPAPPNANYGYPPPSYANYGYPPPSYDNYSPRQPLPLWEAIKQLPRQYLRVLIKPGAATFAEEKQKAAWNIIWIQLALLAIISALIGFVNYTFVLPTTFSRFAVLFHLPASINANLADQYSSGMALQGSLNALISAPISAFISWTILYGLAKLFKGRGEFVVYCYCSALIVVPIQIISGLLLLIPYVGLFLNFAVSIYTYVLIIFMTMAVHRLSGGKASLAVLILPICGMILAIIAVMMFLLVLIPIISQWPFTVIQHAG